MTNLFLCLIILCIILPDFSMSSINKQEIYYVESLEDSGKNSLRAGLNENNILIEFKIKGDI